MISASVETPLHVIVLMPVRDDWLSAAELVRRLDRTIPSGAYRVDILLVDDGSIEDCRSIDFQNEFLTVKAVRKLRLRRNVGHQRAIAIGLSWIHDAAPCDAILVMDADGEDTADGALLLLESFVNAKASGAIFAERSRRTESLVFRLFYSTYKGVHWVLTGISVRVGNFSILPAKYLPTLAVVSELWNHYAAAVIRSRLPFTMVPIPRGYRIAGESRMNFVSLVAHGLSAMSIFGDIIGVRILLASMLAAILVGFAIAAVIAIRAFSDVVMPGWATYACGTLAILLMQLLLVGICFTFFILSSRMNLGFLPMRDYSFFVAEVVELYPQRS